MIATGTLIQKIACQFQPSITAPPTSGPTATPRPEMPPHRPIASGRRSGATPPAMSASESGMTAAPPKPCRARAAISWPGSVLSAASTEPMPKTAMPIDEDRAAAEPVAERGRDEDRAREGERVGVHEPLQLFDARAELRVQHRQRVRHDEVVEGGHEHRAGMPRRRRARMLASAPAWRSGLRSWEAPSGRL